jgi:hypothetical protein
MLPVIAGADVVGDVVVRVRIDECRNGYARVAAYPPPQPGHEEFEQVFLADRVGRWEVLTWGSGLGCLENEFETLPELRTACDALHLPRTG